MVLFLIGFGLLIGHMPWRQVNWRVVAVAAAVLCVVRSLTGQLGLCFQGQASGRERLAISFLGIKGIGSVYYMAYAMNHHDFAHSETLWAVVILTIMGSIIMHGMSTHVLLNMACKNSS